MKKLFCSDDVVELWDNYKPTGRTFKVLGNIADDTMVRIDGQVLTFDAYSGNCHEHTELSIKQPKQPDMGMIEGYILNMHRNATNDRLSDKDYREVVTDMLNELVKEFE